MKFKQKIKKGFSNLEKLGYTTKIDFWCCRTCAWNALTDTQAERAVFLTQQDTDDIKDGYVYLNWSGEGKEIVNAFNGLDLNIEWDGTLTNRIRINEKH